MDTTNKKQVTYEFGVKKVEAILTSGDFDQFIGKRENQNFEAKPKLPYDIGSIDTKKKLHAVAEISSDIVHLANAGEAYIVCGLTTTKLQNAPHDIVDGLDLIEKDYFYKQKEITGILSANTYPQIEVNVGWYSYSKSNGKGLGVVHIPKQAEERKLFIVQVCEVEVGLAYPKTYFGIPVRVDDYKKWLSVKEIYKLTRNTQKNIKDMYDGFLGHIQNIEDKMESLKKRTLQPSVKKNGLEAKIKDTLYGKK